MIRTFIISFLFYLPFHLIGQNPHYTQFNLLPITENPAFTGNADGIRTTVVYEREFRTLSPFVNNNLILSVDAPISINSNSYIGVGLNGQRNLEFYFKNLQMSLPLSYNYILSKTQNQHQIISIGYEPTFFRKSPETKDIRFINQIGPNGFDPTIPTGYPSLDNGPFTSSIHNLGVSYQTKFGPDEFFQAGLTALNFTESENIYFGSEIVETERLFSLQVLASVNVLPMFSISPWIRAYKTTSSSHFELGSIGNFHLSESSDSKIGVGLSINEGTIAGIINYSKRDFTIQASLMKYRRFFSGGPSYIEVGVQNIFSRKRQNSKEKMNNLSD